MLVQLDQWIPDADDTSQGTIIDVENMLPTVRGYQATPAPVSPGLAALSAECKTSSIVTLLDGTNVLFAGTQTKIYKAGASTWTDVTRVSGDYTGSATSKWVFAQQGNLTLAVNGVDTSQKYVHGTDTDFSNLTAMPVCYTAEAVGQFIMIGDYIDPVGSIVTHDGWACSAIGDYTDWTADVNTQCVYGRLVDTPGAVVSVKRLGDYAIYYKRRSMYLARYVGTPSIWDFSLVSDIVGAVSHEAIAKVGTTHYFLGDDDFYSYDTASVKPISGAIKEWFNSSVNNKYRNLTQALHDRINGLVYWFYVSVDSSTKDSYVVYHYRTEKWGKGSISVEAVTEYVTGGRTYAVIQAAYPLYSAYSGVLYSDLVISEGTPKPAIIDTSHVLKTITGYSENSNITPNLLGTDDRKTTIRRVRSRYMSAPDTASMVNYYSDQVGSDFTEDATTSENNGKFDVLRTARWHRAKISFTGNVELSGFDIDAVAGGLE
jgi:hypothetical protein